MRQVSSVLLVMSAIALAVVSAAISPAQAQSGSVKAIFEKYNLLGTFAWDCSKPASKQNNYFVHRVIDADHVQRDMMEGQTSAVLS